MMIDPKKTEYDWQIGQPPPYIEEHSLAKHRVLASYLHRYVEVVAANPRVPKLELTLVDGFAGGGEFTYGSEILPGSPLIMMSEIESARIEQQALRKNNFSLKAEYIFIERNKKNFEYLRHTIYKKAPTKAHDTISVINSSFEEKLPDLLRHIKAKGQGERCFFLLDQTGYSLASLASIRSILNNVAHPEIIVLFNVDYIIDYLNSSPEFLKAITPVNLEFNHVMEMLSLKDQAGARWFIQRYLLQHLRNEINAKYFTYFFVKPKGRHRSYWLLHLSKHYRARDVMGKEHWANKNHFIHHGPSGLKIAGYDANKDIRQQTFDFTFGDDEETITFETLLDEVPQELYQYHCVWNQPVQISTLFSENCSEMVGTSDHLFRTIVRLRDEKEVDIKDKNGRPKPRAENLSWSDVVHPIKTPTFFSRIKLK